MDARRSVRASSASRQEAVEVLARSGAQGEMRSVPPLRRKMSGHRGQLSRRHEPREQVLARPARESSCGDARDRRASRAAVAPPPAELAGVHPRQLRERAANHDARCRAAASSDAGANSWAGVETGRSTLAINAEPLFTNVLPRVGLARRVGRARQCARSPEPRAAAARDPPGPGGRRVAPAVRGPRMSEDGGHSARFRRDHGHTTRKGFQHRRRHVVDVRALNVDVVVGVVRRNPLLAPPGRRTSRR